MNYSKMPVIFIGHGSPENALLDDEFTDSWKEIAKNIPKPKAILCISAHWLTEGVAITAMEKPRTIHDFYGFEDELYKVKYPAKGSKKIAGEIKEAITSFDISLDNEWGLDHGSWSVLLHMYPEADVPVLQLSINQAFSIQKHFELAKELSKLRDKGILIIGSGNIIHNLSMMSYSKPYSWAFEFDEFVKQKIIEKNYLALIDYSKNKSANLAVPTNDHYIPLIYVLGSSLDEKPIFFNEKIVLGSIGMRCVMFK